MNYDALRDAIQREVLITSGPHARIIASDEISEAPWVFDFRALLLQSRWLKMYAEIFWDLFGSKYPFQVCGMESAAISLVAAIVMEGVTRGKDVNGLFIRKSRKRHGLMKRIEGTANAHAVILVDDLLNSGATFESQIKVLEREGLSVSDLFALVAFRETSAYAHLLANGRSLQTLFTLADFGLSPQPLAVRKPQFEEVWRFAAPNPSYNFVLQKSAPAIDNEQIYFGTDAGAFYALDQKNGSIVWKFQIGRHPAGKGIFSSPALHEGSLFFGAYDGGVYALDAKTGVLRWNYPDADWVGSSPAISAKLGLIFVGLEFGLWRKRGGIAALDAKTGRVAWEHRSPEYTHGSPLYIEQLNMVVIGSNDDAVYAYQADSGKSLWQFKTPGGAVKSSFAYDTEHQLILFGSLGEIAYALSPKGECVFAKELRAGVYSTPCIVGNAAIVSSLDKYVYAFELPSGKKLWEYRTDGRIFASPISIDSCIYVGSNDGRLHEIDLKTGEGGPVFQASERIVNKIAYDQNSKRFFVPTVGNEIYCLRRP